MKKNTLLLLVVPSLFLFSCSRPVIVDAIDETEARDFIERKYEDTTYQQPLFEKTLVNWKITKDNEGKAAKHIGRYLSNPDIPTPVEGEKGNKIHIENADRINTFKTELEDLTTDPEILGNPGHEAVLALNPTIYEALYHGQGQDNYSLVFKYVGSGASRGLKITSKYNGTDLVYNRVHTYNKDGHETKFELTYSNGNDLNYSLTISFKY